MDLSFPGPQALPQPRQTTVDGTAQRDAKLMKAAQALETAFLAEMLGHAGLGAMPEGFGGGGAGEEQFASFLREAQAEKMVQHGGIGLAERLFHALKERADGTD